MSQTVTVTDQDQSPLIKIRPRPTVLSIDQGQPPSFVSLTTDRPTTIIRAAPVEGPRYRFAVKYPLVLDDVDPMVKLDETFIKDRIDLVDGQNF